MLRLTSVTSYRESQRLLCDFWHRKEADAPRLRTMADLVKRIGQQLCSHAQGFAAETLSHNGFSEATGLPLSDSQLSASIKQASRAAIEGTVMLEAWKRADAALRPGAPCPIPSKGDMEVPEMSCYVSVDDVGVKHQKEHRKGAAAKSGKYVENTVAKVQADGKEYLLTGIGMEQTFRLLLAFLLHNHLLEERHLIFFTDGARNIRNNIEGMFGFHPFRIILDWYHLKKKCQEHLSMAMRGSKVRNDTLERLLPLLWCGNVEAARSYLQGLERSLVKNAQWIEKLDAYLCKNQPFIPCYAVRRELGLRNSSSPVEKANDLLVAQRQKHNGMSWSKDGSGALAAIRMMFLNGEERAWIARHTLSFALHTPIGEDKCA